MSQVLNLKIKGLHTYPNELGEMPEGALVAASNVVIDAESKVKSRRGFKQFGDALDESVSSILTYKSKLLVNYSDRLYYDASVSSLGDWTQYTGTFLPPSSGRMRAIESNSNLYFTSSTGIRKLDTLTSTPSNSGIPKALDLEVVVDGAGGFLDNNHKTAYIVIWGKRDANDVLALGSPSNRADITNSSGASRNVIVEFSIPAEITTAYFYQVYRAKMVTTTPRTDYYLVYESNPTAGQITAKKITFTDNVPESLNKGVAAYTSSTREGISGSNEQAPYAEDIAFFKNMVFYGNIKRKHQKTFTILSVLGASGVANGDQVTIAGIIYQGDTTAEYIPTSPGDTNVAKFKLSASGSPGTAIEETAKSLVRVINRNPVNTGVYAYYISGINDLPGKILVEARIFTGSSFSIQANLRGSTAYSPSITTAIVSTNEEKKNGICWSKLQEPEAVPFKYFQTVGAADKAILRIIPIRDSLFIFKEDGIFKLTGSSPDSISIVLFDNTTRLLAPETAASLNNQVFIFSDQGIATVSDSGVGIISRPIEGDLLEISSSNATFFKTVSHAIGYETERKYILFTLADPSDLVPTRAYVYNTFTNSWTTWNISAKAAILNPADDKLYFSTHTNEMRVERKNFDNRDYADEEYANTIVSYDPVLKKVVLTSNLLVEVGQYLVQADRESIIIEVDIDGVTITIQDELGFEAGACTIYNLIECGVQWAPIHCGNPVLMKQFREAHLLMSQTRFDQCFIGFNTDSSVSVEQVMKVGQPFTRWGRFQWGNTPWGGKKGRKPIRTLVPFSKQRCRWINVSFKHQAAFEVFELTGISLFFSMMSERSST